MYSVYDILSYLFSRMLHYEAGCRNAGNAIGLSDAHRDAVIAYEDTDSRFGHRLVRCTGAQIDDWLIWQMLQDIERGDGVLCFDPSGKYAELLAAYLPEQKVSRTIWFDVSNRQKLMALNPLMGLEDGITAPFYETRDWLFRLFSPLSPEVAHCLDYSLRVRYG